MIVVQIDRNLSEDPRLAVLKSEWFEGKDCLDVGCNQGLVTIGVGMVYGFSWWCLIH